MQVAKRRRGVSTTQFALVAATVCVTVVAGVKFLGSATNTDMNRTADNVADPGSLVGRWGNQPYSGGSGGSGGSSNSGGDSDSGSGGGGYGGGSSGSGDSGSGGGSDSGSGDSGSSGGDSGSGSGDSGGDSGGGGLCP